MSQLFLQASGIHIGQSFVGADLTGMASPGDSMHYGRVDRMAQMSPSMQEKRVIQSHVHIREEQHSVAGKWWLWSGMQAQLLHPCVILSEQLM